MGLVEFQIELHRTNELLDRIAIALERMAGPTPPTTIPPVQATLSDLIDCSPNRVGERLSQMEDFAKREMLVPGSEAFLERIREFEELVRVEYGEQAMDELPWRKP